MKVELRHLPNTSQTWTRQSRGGRVGPAKPGDGDVRSAGVGKEEGGVSVGKKRITGDR